LIYLNIIYRNDFILRLH